MSKSTLTAMISSIVHRMLQGMELNKQSEQPKEYMSSKLLQLLLDEINKQLEGRQFNTLNWEMAECQAMLEQFHISNRKIYKDIKLIRHTLFEMRQRVERRYRMDVSQNRQPLKTNRE